MQNQLNQLQCRRHFPGVSSNHKWIRNGLLSVFCRCLRTLCRRRLSYLICNVPHEALGGEAMPLPCCDGTAGCWFGCKSAALATTVIELMSVMLCMIIATVAVRLKHVISKSSCYVDCKPNLPANDDKS